VRNTLVSPKEEDKFWVHLFRHLCCSFPVRSYFTLRVCYKHPDVSPINANGWFM